MSSYAPNFDEWYNPAPVTRIPGPISRDPEPYYWGGSDNGVERTVWLEGPGFRYQTAYLPQYRGQTPTSYEDAVRLGYIAERVNTMAPFITTATQDNSALVFVALILVFWKLS